jgi:hypothetical protein
MTDYSFPLRTAREFVERLESLPPNVDVRRWVMRDDNQQHHHGLVRLAEDPLHLELYWKPDARGKEQRIGLFRLHLRRLAEAGYARPEGNDPSAGEIRLRFHRGARGVVCIQAREADPSLAVGVIDVTLG